MKQQIFSGQSEVASCLYIDCEMVFAMMDEKQCISYRGRLVMTQINTNMASAAAQAGIAAYTPRAAEAVKPAPRVIEATKLDEPAVKVDPLKLQQDLRQVVDLLNKNMEKLGRNLGFSIDRKAGHTVVTVKDQISGNVIRQIPDEAVLRMAHSIADMRGLFLNKEG